MTHAHSRIYGSGFVVGEVLVKNERMARICDTSDEWIRERSGIEQRYFVNEGTATSDLALAASVKALADAGWQASDVDYIVVATMTPDYYFPGVGSVLQAKLKIGNIPALDIRQQCSGFIYGLQVCDALIRAQAAKKILFVGCEIHSGFMPFSKQAWDVVLGQSDDPIPQSERDFNSRFRHLTVLFGDAAGAVCIAPTDNPERGILGFSIHSDGSDVESLYVPSGGFAYRPYFSEAHLREARFVPVMDGRNVFKMAVTKMPESLHKVLQSQSMTVDDVELIIPHQANLRISEAVQKQLKVPDARMYNNIQKYGNTTAATIPIAYDECRKSGRLKQGDLVAFIGLGAGFHWGAALMRE
jgi:3-oxoacyl-[acyl-carrier-protein] synthase III